MPITIKVDFKGVEARMNKAVNNTKAEVVRELNKFAEATVTDAKLNTNPNVDNGFLKNSIAPILATPDKLMAGVVVACNYAAYVEFGTRKFAARYVASLPQDWQSYAASFKGKAGGSMDDFIQNIMAWVLRKGIGGAKTKSGNLSTSKSSLDQMQQAAFNIALYILRNGVRAHPFLFPAVQKNTKLLLDRLK